MLGMSKREALEEIARKIRNCRKCPLWENRRNAVPGEGNPDTRIMFVGEAPGFQEDVQGRPFVGAAGKLLTSLIERILGMKRDDVYITNVVKCRPPNNRDPRLEEIDACSPYLDSQIEIISPEIIVCLGRYSARYILSRAGVSFRSILAVRGKIFEVQFGGKKIKVIATIHPAAALYKPPWRKFLEEDFRRIRGLLTMSREKITLDAFI